GHSGDRFNDLADRLAVEAASTQRPRSGAGIPDAVGPADEDPARGRGDGAAPVPSGPPVPPGHLLAVLGHRPPELGGYDDNPVARDTRRRLGEIIGSKAEMVDDLAVLTGLGLGAEQLAAEAALDLGVPYVAVEPFPDPDSAWPQASRDHYRTLVDGAREVVRLERKVPDGRAKVAGSMRRRDAWLARAASEAVLVWNRTDERLAKLAGTLEDHLGDDVWILEPTGE
ncbi:MAG: hypothetical protein AAGK32_18985, partial [Actinomycetota bacterium]